MPYLRVILYGESGSYDTETPGRERGVVSGLALKAVIISIMC